MKRGMISFSSAILNVESVSGGLRVATLSFAINFAFCYVYLGCIYCCLILVRIRSIQRRSVYGVFELLLRRTFRQSSLRCC